MNVTKYGYTIRVDKTLLVCAICDKDLSNETNFVMSLGSYMHRACDPLTQMFDRELDRLVNTTN